MPRAATRADSRGWSTTRTHALMISAGTTTLNTPGGSASRAQAPASAPAHDARPSLTSLPRWPASSSRYPKTLLTLPGTKPTLLETLATTGGEPKASSGGDVISDPEPTTAFIAPGASAAGRIGTNSPLATRTPTPQPRRG